MKDQPKLTADELAERLTDKPSTGKRMLARLTLCAALAIGGTASATTPNEAYENGYAVGQAYAATGLMNGMTEPDPSLQAAFNEGVHDALCDAGLFGEAEAMGGAPCSGDDGCGCSSGGDGCGCGCGD